MSTSSFGRFRALSRSRADLEDSIANSGNSSADLEDSIANSGNSSANSSADLEDSSSNSSANSGNSSANSSPAVLAVLDSGESSAAVPKNMKMKTKITDSPRTAKKPSLFRKKKGYKIRPNQKGEVALVERVTTALGGSLEELTIEQISSYLRSQYIAKGANEMVQSDDNVKNVGNKVFYPQSSSDVQNIDAKRYQFPVVVAYNPRLAADSPASSATENKHIIIDAAARKFLFRKMSLEEVSATKMKTHMYCEKKKKNVSLGASSKIIS